MLTGTMALIGVGANLPTPAGLAPVETCRQAVALLDGIPGVRLKGLSRWFVSAPVPPSDQPKYVNAVAMLSAVAGQAIYPPVLLARLQSIEAAFGRRRDHPNAARTLDLDIIAVGRLTLTMPDLIVPHPRAHSRAFVLAPLADVAPDWVHPTLGRTAAALLSELPRQDVALL